MKLIAQLLALAVFIFCGLSFALFKQIHKTKPHCDVDSGAYIRGGMMIYQDGSFAQQKQMPYYSLGYPAFVGFVYKAFGPENKNVVVVQVILALLSVLLLFQLAYVLFSLKVALASFLLFSFNLGYLVFAQFVLTEIVLAFLLLLFVNRLCLFYKTHRDIQLLLAGFSLGLSIVIKPAAIYFILPLVGWILFFCLVNQLSFIKFASIVVMAFYLPIVGLMLHNKMMFNEFSVCNLSTVNMHYWFFPNVLAFLHNTSHNAEREELHKMTDNEVHKFFVVTIKKYSFTAAKVWLLNMTKTLLGLFTTNLKVLVDEKIGGGMVSFFMTEGTLLKRAYNYVIMGTSLTWVHCVGFLEVLYSLLRYIFCVIGMWYLFISRKYLLLMFFVLYIGYFVGITGHDGCARFRMMVEFLLILLTALGLMYLLDKKNQKIY